MTWQTNRLNSRHSLPCSTNCASLFSALTALSWPRSEIAEPSELTSLAVSRDSRFAIVAHGSNVSTAVLPFTQPGLLCGS
jgi:hypothetical protein